MACAVQPTRAFTAARHQWPGGSRGHRLPVVCAAQSSSSSGDVECQAPLTSLRQRLAAAAAAAALLLAAPVGAAEEVAAASALGDVTPVYFGNGCFWGRQYDFIQTEKALGRDASSMSAVVGYAGGRTPSQADGKVCYYSGPRGSVYEELGHAETVQVDLRGDPAQAERQFRAFAKTYFSQFRKTPFGMLRQDPQDVGPGYRNVVGLPGGVDSPLFPLLQEANIYNMKLLPGNGNAYDPSAAAAAPQAAALDSARGAPVEGDEFNTVWVLDSNQLGFNRAEQYHQFHNGLGKAFPKSYTEDLKRQMAAAGTIGETGCPEFFYF
ncbi:Peptide methionine sulfoxide reductase [Chlorella sorokiniana]|uniref:peptide-methionine (S)-S-oxide reductase n=1 Tax=Chlorella sorokiniana TaxID=3076 RepID=A0A2P6TBM1_CHLSO|nr:Peptide methionine sulfoxide reductase [Chlorella sorokiniana]|eukprot:PRW05953.1 Peptide methionine sulfoxide reductase [Chlorella sorokiniana]